MDEGPLRDPEFVPSPAVPPAPRDEASVVDPEAYQRLVANPFLAFAAWVFWLPATGWIMRWVGRLDRLKPGREALDALLGLGAMLLIAAGFLAPFFLFQFHCLDCGRTDRLSRWRGHACPKIDSRRALGRPRRLRGPTPPVQLMLWLWASLAIARAWGSFRH